MYKPMILRVTVDHGFFPILLLPRPGSPTPKVDSVSTNEETDDKKQEKKLEAENTTNVGTEENNKREEKDDEVQTEQEKKEGHKSEPVEDEDSKMEVDEPEPVSNTGEESGKIEFVAIVQVFCKKNTYELNFRKSRHPSDPFSSPPHPSPLSPKAKPYASSVFLCKFT